VLVFWFKYIYCTSYAVAVDSRKLVSCGNDGFLKIFDVTTGSEVFAKNNSSQLKSVFCYCMLFYWHL